MLGVEREIEEARGTCSMVPQSPDFAECELARSGVSNAPLWRRVVWRSGQSNT
jgi:hypothetical protein